MTYIPVAQLKKESGGYIPVSEFTGKKQEPISFDLGLQPDMGIAQTTPAVLPEGAILPQDALKVMGQGMARQWAATGAKIAQKSRLSTDDLVDPKTFFGTSPSARSLGVSIFGREEPFNATSEDVEFLEVFGADPEVVKKFGGSLTILLSYLDVLGAQPFKGLVGLIRTLKKADNAIDVARAMKSVGFADDVIEAYKDVFVPLKKTKEVKSALDAAISLQSKTTGKGYRPVGELLKDGIPQEVKPISIISDFPTKGGFVVDRFSTEAEAKTALYGIKKQFKNAYMIGEEITPTITKELELPKIAIRKVSEIPTGKQLDELARRVRELRGKTKEEISFEIGQLSEQSSYYSEVIEDMPGRQLKKFISRKEGQFVDVPDPSKAKTTAEKIRLMEREKKIYQAAESAFEGTPLSNKFDNIDVIKQAIEDYDVAKTKMAEVQEQLTTLRKEATTIRKGERATSIGIQQRRMQYRAIGNRYDLTDNDLRKFLHGRNISALEQDEWEQFVTEANLFGIQTEKRRDAMTQLEFTVQDKDLKNWKNVQAALNLPPVHQMNTEQLINFEKILDQYKSGDEFLPVRMMQTISNTELAGVKTTREVLETLSKKSGKALEDVEKIKATEWHRALGDRRLAREHPFYEVLVERKNRAFIESNARIIELTDEIDNLLKKARASQKPSLLERAVPTDEKIVRWLETDADGRASLEMTKEELVATERIDKIFHDYYDYLVKRHAEQKFSRFEGQYFPHVRRGFLEAWKEDGVVSAFKEMRDKYRQDAFTMDILNEKTQEILPYEKWIGFAQFRSGNLIPTKNAAKAFEAYVTALEKARHLDAMTPEIMAYVHSLSPRTFSQFGVELDVSLKKFVREYLNANKGRTPKGFFNPGGNFDVINRSLLALTRMIDLGWNFTTQLVSPVGENLMTLTMLKPEAYTKAQLRAQTKAGKEVLNKYKSFVGRSPWEEMTRAANDIGDKFMAGAFSIFGQSTKQANGLFLLGKMTDEEFKTGLISVDRLTKLRLEMSKYRHIKGMESILGRTTEAEAAKQYKSWAIPPLTATVENAVELARIIRSDGLIKSLSSDAGKELFYSIGIGSAIGLLTYGKYKELSKKGAKRSFMEDLAYKAMRDAVSIFGVFDPTMWSGVRVADFL